MRQQDLYETMMLVFDISDILPDDAPSPKLGFSYEVCKKMVDGYLLMKPDEIWFVIYKDTLETLTPAEIKRLSVRLEILSMQLQNNIDEKKGA